LIPSVVFFLAVFYNFLTIFERSEEFCLSLETFIFVSRHISPNTKNKKIPKKVILVMGGETGWGGGL
jgi:hypothetical protein